MKKNLKCLRTGEKAKIVSQYNKNNTAYVKINILIKFQDTYFQVNKTFEENDIQNHFSCS